MYYNEKFTTITETELTDTNGGGPIVGGLIFLGICGIVGLGVYNGYNDTKDQKK